MATPSEMTDQLKPQAEFSSGVVDIPKLNTTLDTLTNFITQPIGARKDNSDPVAVEFVKKAALEAAEFKARYEVDANILTSELRKKLSGLVHQDESPTGPHQLAQVGQAVIRFWNGIEFKEKSPESQKMAGLPGHDKRHLLEDLTAGLVFRSDVVTDIGASNDEYQKIGLIGSFTHDFGRMLEVRINGTQQGGELGDKHAELSFYTTKQILDCFPKLDPTIKDHILYSILVHQQWPKKELENTPGYKMTMNEPINRSVMGSDRLQLVGPEAILRFIGFDIGEGLLGFETAVNPQRKTQLDNKAETSLAEHVEFYMRNLLPVEVPGSSAVANKKANQQALELKAISGAFIWLSSTDQIREQIFAPELARDPDFAPKLARDPGQTVDEVKLAENKKRILAPDVWAEVKRQIELAEGGGSDKVVKAEIDLVTTNKSSTDLATHLVSSENASVTAKGLVAIKDRIGKVTDPKAQERLAIGLGYAAVMRDRYDQARFKTLVGIQNNTQQFPANSLERTFASFVLQNFSSSSSKAA